MGNVILGLLLLVGPQTLYSLGKQFQAGPSLFYRASFGALHSALRTLEAAGSVTATEEPQGGRRKKVFRITPAGEAVVHAWLRAPLGDGDLELAALSRTFLLGLVEDAAERRRILDGIVAAIEAELAGLEAVAVELDAAEAGIPEQHRTVFRYQRATLDYGITAHRGARDWYRRLAAEG
ncbi:PadR family transcriptional regulator [Pseudolysinimonas sp.]